MIAWRQNWDGYQVKKLAECELLNLSPYSNAPSAYAFINYTENIDLKKD